MTQTIVGALRLLIYGVLFVAFLCTFVDGRSGKKYTFKEPVYLDSCADEIDRWSCGEEPDSSDEECVRKDQVCDGRDNCQNGNDERDCPDCSNGEGFNCGNNEGCIPDSFVCDGDNDCDNWNDEESCSGEPCKPGYYRCDSGKCIEEDKLCDGREDCENGDDEYIRVCQWHNSNDEWYITLVVIGVLLFIVVLCSVVTNKYRRNRRNTTPPPNRRVDGRTSISMEMTFPSGPPSYEATMSATMSVNPAFTDESSIVSGDIPPDDDLPPPYESIANEVHETLEPVSRENTNSEGSPEARVTSETQQPRSGPISRSTSTGEVNSSVVREVVIEESQPSSAPPESPTVDDAPSVIEEEGRHI